MRPDTASSRPATRRLFALFALVFGSSLVACPGELDDPAAYTQLPACPGNIDVEALFATKCGSAICHGGQSSDPAAHLDLTSPGVEHRLVGIRSESCSGELRIDPDAPDQSFLLAKITEPPAACGDRMPIVGILSTNEIACIRSWIHSVASTPIVDAGMDAGRDASVDAGSDAFIDAGADAGPDAAVDGGP